MIKKFMDRRTWLQLITILTAAREAHPQQRGGPLRRPPMAPDAVDAGEGGLQNLPMRITKDQVVGALKLMGLEFQDSELDMMLRGVNQAISNYETSAQGRRADRHRTCALHSIPACRTGSPSRGRNASTRRFRRHPP